MATTTPNYGWPVPTSTDLVKDGAVAIEALGDAIDATVFGLGGSSGLTLIAAQTIGTAVSSVTVSNCFSATYDSYQVFINNSSASGTDYISLRLGVSGTPSTATYDSGFVQTAYSGSAVSGAGSPNANRVEYAGRCTAFFVELDCKIIDPFTIKHTRFHSQYTNGDVGAMHHVGLHRQTTSYNDLIVISNAATMTGGTIRVYGYQNTQEKNGNYNNKTKCTN